MGRRHRRSKVTRVVNLIKRIIAFFFSHVGLCALVIGYGLLGAVVFRAVEGPHEEYIQKEVSAARGRAINVAWNTTFSINKLDKSQWEKVVYAQVKIFQKKCMWAIRRGYDGKEHGVSAQWTFTGSFLYSLTVITTFLYARSIRLKYKIILWHKKRQAAKIRRANSLVAKLARSSSNRHCECSKQKANNLKTFKIWEVGERLEFRDDCSLESLGITPAANVNDVHDLLAARAQLDQLEVKESVEAQLQRISVPLSLVLLTMLAYLIAGSILFCLWEGWTFLDSFYFCYISLTTIGFGDKFPGASVGNDREAQEKLVITSVYLLFGMALLAMSFNLAQEEVVVKVAWLANKFRSKDEYDEE
ncbi:Potassium channel subfamily K member 18 [Aphelenchoides bicaudatus]|nr:Potassium channel subfamily K member 18 [Aphelenchoides bicaudatus]